jgi:hypothetical protein
MPPMMFMQLAQAGLGIGQGIAGIFQNARANKMARNNPRPIYNIPNEVFANQQMAQQMATQGMPAQEYQNTLKGIQTQQAAALAASTDRRGGLSNIASIQGQSNAAMGNLQAQSAEQRIANIRNLMAQNNQLAGYRDKAWDYNKRQKFEENAAAIRALKGSATQNMTQGFGSALGAAGGFMGGMFGGGKSPNVQGAGGAVGRAASFAMPADPSILASQNASAYPNGMMDYANDKLQYENQFPN